MGYMFKAGTRILAGASFHLYIQYNGLGITHTPRECAGLARGFAVLGLDKLFLGKSVDATGNTGILRLRCSQSTVSRFAEDDKCFKVLAEQTTATAKAKAD